MLSTNRKTRVEPGELQEWLPPVPYILGSNRGLYETCRTIGKFRREQMRGDRYGTVTRQFERVHRHGIYGVTVDTGSSTPEAGATQIISCVTGKEPVAFGRLRATS